MTYLKKIYILLFLFLISCSSIDKQRISPAYFEAFGAIKDYFSESDNEFITPEVISNIPYASLKLRIGKGKPGLLILEQKTQEKELWISADQVYLVIENGRIIQTKGLFNNLTSYISQGDILKNALNNKLLETSVYYSYDEPLLANLPVEVKLKKVGLEEVNLINKKIKLNLIEEQIINSYINWKVKNYFWVDDEGYVWKSIQNISPKLPPFEFEVTKKPAE